MNEDNNNQEPNAASRMRQAGFDPAVQVVSHVRTTGKPLFLSFIPFFIYCRVAVVVAEGVVCFINTSQCKHCLSGAVLLCCNSSTAQRASHASVSVITYLTLSLTGTCLLTRLISHCSFCISHTDAKALLSSCGFTFFCFFVGLTLSQNLACTHKLALCVATFLNHKHLYLALEPFFRDELKSTQSTGQIECLTL